MARFPQVYRTAEWQRAREVVIARAYGLCEDCARQGRVEAGAEVHHVIHLDDSNWQDWNVAYNPDNLLLVCRDCHFGQHRERGGLQKFLAPAAEDDETDITLVCGPPGSGKTTYVRERAGRGDLVVDLDAIVSAISGLPWYDSPREIMPFAWEARDAIINRLSRKHGVKRAWVIATLPKRQQRESLRQRLGAQLVVLDVPADECIRRIRKDERRQHAVALHEELVRSWWRDYEPHDCSSSEGDYRLGSAG